MKTVFPQKRFYPQHFILSSTNPTAVEEIANCIVSEAAALSQPDFNGETLCFRFNLRYRPPYEYAEYKELRRLQAEAIGHTRFKDAYRGFILLDVSEWASHFDEELFRSITVPFLADMSDCWKYIFLVRDETDRAALRATLQDRIWVGMPDMDALMLSVKPRSVCGTLSKEYNVTFFGTAEPLARKFFDEPNRFKNEEKQRIVRDVVAYFGPKTVIIAPDLLKYLSDEITYIYTLLSEEDHALIHKLTPREEKDAC